MKKLYILINEIGGAMTKRNSNMELLRITAILMIIEFHIFVHCIDGQLTHTDSIQELGNGWYCKPMFSKELCILAAISPMGQVGNAIFILISGYFMAEKYSIDLTKISKKLLLQLGFATVALGLASIYAYNNITEFPIELVQFSAFNGMSWYAGYYFTVIVIAKLYLNGLLRRLDRKNYVMLLMVLFALIQFSWSINVMYNFVIGMETLCTGLFLYSLGGYVKKYDPFGRIRLWAVLAVIIVMNLFVIGSFYINTAENILAYDPESSALFIQSIPQYLNNQIVPVVLGIAVFELFRRLKVPNSSAVNFIGASTFMTYLIHDNKFFYKIWNIEDWITLLHENIMQFHGVFWGWVLITFAVGILCYAIFAGLSKLLNICKPLAIKQTAQV